MNKLITLLLTLCMALSGCGGNAPASEQPETTPVNPAVPSAETSAGDSSSQSRVLIAYFSVPEDVPVTGVDAVAGASIVVSDGEKLGNTQYVAAHKDIDDHFSACQSAKRRLVRTPINRHPQIVADEGSK